MTSLVLETSKGPLPSFLEKSTGKNQKATARRKKTSEVKKHWKSDREKIKNLKCHFAKGSSDIQITFDLPTQGHSKESEIFTWPSEFHKTNPQESLQTTGRNQDPCSSGSNSDLMSDAAFHRLHSLRLPPLLNKTAFINLIH